MRPDASVGETFKSVYAKKTQKPFVFIKKPLKKRPSKNDSSNEAERKSPDKALLDVVV
ncbi:MAG: hypothetical protein N3A62_09450 [Thermodesulfovibrionales bacterium]|nr:hypothetical protein [Thermodesulfovibrionales bacterium]